MGLFRKLVFGISDKIALASRSFTYAEKLKNSDSNIEVDRIPQNEDLIGKNRLQLLADGYRSIAELENEYTTIATVPKKDDEDNLVSNVFLGDLDSRLDNLYSKRNARRVENYARCLEETMTDLDKKIWENSRIVVKYGDKWRMQSAPAIREEEVRNTLIDYLEKLKSNDTEGKYSELVKSVSDKIAYSPNKESYARSFEIVNLEEK